MTLPFRVIEGRPWSVIVRRAGAHVFRDQHQWETLWPRIGWGADRAPALGIDWSTEMLVIVAAGAQANTGYGVRVDEIRVVADVIEFRGRLVKPGPNCLTGQMITYPTQPLIVAAHDGAVRLILPVEIQDCPD